MSTFALIVGILSGVSFYLLGHVKGVSRGRLQKHEENLKDFQSKMKAEYERGVKASQKQIDQLNVTLNKLQEDKKSWHNTVTQLEKDKDVAETERDQYAHQIEDLISEQKQLKQELQNSLKRGVERDAANLEYSRRNAELSNQIENLKESHGYDLIDHGNTIREETLNKLLTEIEEFVESKKRHVVPVNQEKQPSFKIQGTGVVLPPEVSDDYKIQYLSGSSNDWPDLPSRNYSGIWR